MTLESHLPAIAIGSGIAGLVFTGLIVLFQTDRRVTTRIRNHSAQKSPGVASRPESTKESGVVSALLEGFASRREAVDDPLRTRLLHAGFHSPLASSVFTVLQGLTFIVSGGGAFYAAHAFRMNWVDSVLAGSTAACLGFLLPSGVVRRRTLRRKRELELAIPDFLDLLVTCMDAGLSLEGALQRITNEITLAHPLLGEELLRVERDIELGASCDRALQGLAERCDLDVLRMLANACSQARRFGSRLSQTLRTLAETLREQREQRAEELAQASAVKILIPTLVLLFPIIFVVLAGPAVMQITEQFAQSGVRP